MLRQRKQRETKATGKATKVASEAYEYLPIAKQYNCLSTAPADK